MTFDDIIKFKRDTAFRKTFFVPDSFVHPAKMDAQLLIWIVEKYTEAGETILDCMAGSGTTMLACSLGRNAILVELEEKFCKMCRDNWEQVKMRPQLGYSMGECQIIQGDTRNLEAILCNVQQSDIVVSSPPYGEAIGRDAKYYEKIDTANKKRALEMYDKQLPSYTANLQYSYVKDNMGNTAGNIGNLKYGDTDSISISPQSIPLVNHIITSPPYEGTLEASSRHTKGGIPGRDKVLGQTGTYATLEDAEIIAKKVSKGFQSPEAIKMIEMIEGLPRGYAQNPANIGNFKSDSYLEAMLQVYQQCFAVLKSGGLMILVVKPFIRQKTVVHLEEDTKVLAEKAGFTFVEQHYRILSSMSFWRVIYYKKYPMVERLDKEYILVFKKQSDKPASQASRDLTPQ